MDVECLPRSVGLATDQPANPIGAALDEHFGTWTDDDVSRLGGAIAVFEQVDEDLWK